MIVLSSGFGDRDAALGTVLKTVRMNFYHPIVSLEIERRGPPLWT